MSVEESKLLQGGEKYDYKHFNAGAESVDSRLEHMVVWKNNQQQKSLSSPTPPIWLLLSLAIFSTVCCFFPTGIIAVLFTAEVSKLKRAGLENEAEHSVDKVFFWVKISVYVGVGTYLVGGLALVLFAGSHLVSLLVMGSGP